MSHSHPLAATTHTVELHQVDEINRRLADPDRVPVTAEMLGLAGEPIPGPPFPGFELFTIGPSAVRTLSGFAVLDHVSAQGAPEFPYLRAHFRVVPAATGKAAPIVTLHTEALARLSRRLRLRHCWGGTAAVTL
jgi:hypothetical protein